MTIKVKALLPLITWDKAIFISDRPGKNKGDAGLGGGGEATDILLNRVSKAKRSITIQSPYLVMPEGALDIFEGLIKNAVKIRVVTNSLASTDNLLAFSGYQNQKQLLLDAGLDIYEYKPYPAIASELFLRFEENYHEKPVVAIHAKTMVIDGQSLYVGTFNLDPRSANLNTEVGIIVDNMKLAKEVETHIFNDMKAENSWEVRKYNANAEVSIGRRLKLLLYRMLPMQSVL